MAHRRLFEVGGMMVDLGMVEMDVYRIGFPIQQLEIRSPCCQSSTGYGLVGVYFGYIDVMAIATDDLQWPIDDCLMSG